jgi:hypothetical protein
MELSFSTSIENFMMKNMKTNILFNRKIVDYLSCTGVGREVFTMSKQFHSAKLNTLFEIMDLRFI